MRSALPPRVRAIVRTVAARSRIAADDLIWGRSGVPHINQARQRAMFAVRRGLKLGGRAPSFPRIGLWFGRHHATVIHGVRVHARRRAGRRPKDNRS